jgi:hypothetical protein
MSSEDGTPKHTHQPPPVEIPSGFLISWSRYHDVPDGWKRLSDTETISIFPGSVMVKEKDVLVPFYTAIRKI